MYSVLQGVVIKLKTKICIFLNVRFKVKKTTQLKIWTSKIVKTIPKAGLILKQIPIVVLQKLQLSSTVVGTDHAPFVVCVWEWLNFFLFDPVI